MQYLVRFEADDILQKELFLEQHAKPQMKCGVLATQFDSSSQTVHGLMQVIQRRLT